MKMETGLDTGDFCAQAKADVANKSFSQIEEELASIGSDELYSSMKNIDNVS